MAKVLRRCLCAALLALPTVAVVAIPLRARADTWGLPECASALPGSAVLADVHAPLVCEERPPGAPSWATGMWDGTIHLWVTGLADNVVRKTLGHEEGHEVSDEHPDWFAAFGTNREAFAECWSLANYPEPGVGYQCPRDVEVMREWHGTPAPPPTTAAPEPEPPPPAPPPEPVAVVLQVVSRTPVELPAVTPLVAGSAIVITLANERVTTMLGLLHLLAG